MKFLMVCLGNICRSPLGEGVLRHKAENHGLDWEVDSAGTGNWHIGKPPFHMSQHVALKNGIDISRQRGRQFEREDLVRFDRIYFMDRNNYEDAKRIAGNLWDESKCRLLLDELHPGGQINVPDPYGYPETEFEKVFELINAACEAIVVRYGRERDLGYLAKE